MSSRDTSEPQLVPASAVIAESGPAADPQQKNGPVWEIPQAHSNPFINHSDFQQGSFYLIIGPIIAGLVVFYLVGVYVTRLRARSNAKKINETIEEEPMDNSMLHPVYTPYAYQANESRRDVADVSFQDSLLHQTQHIPSSGPLLLSQLDLAQPTTSRGYSPSPPASPARHARHLHGHRRRTSSMVLDDFISTGVIPNEPSMYANSYGNDSYLSLQSPQRPSRSVSPVRRQPVN